MAPAVRILEHLESHESLTAKEAATVLGSGMDSDARRLLQHLEQRQLLRSDHRGRGGAVRYVKGRLFDRWREFAGNGFQTQVLDGHQFEIPGFLRPAMPGSR